MNKQLFKFYGVTEEDYKKWCKENNLPHYKNETLQKYIKYLIEQKEKEGK